MRMYFEITEKDFTTREHQGCPWWVSHPHPDRKAGLRRGSDPPYVLNIYPLVRLELRN
jgi:hypothetical protein